MLESRHGCWNVQNDAGKQKEIQERRQGCGEAQRDSGKLIGTLEGW